MKTFYNRKDEIPRRHVSLCNTIISGNEHAHLLLAKLEEKHSLELGESRGMSVQILRILLSSHLPTDWGSFTLCATQNCQYLCQRGEQRFDFPFCVHNSLGTVSLKLG